MQLNYFVPPPYSTLNKTGMVYILNKRTICPNCLENGLLFEEKAQHNHYHPESLLKSVYYIL